jgi:hypothetical protein
VANAAPASGSNCPRIASIEPCRPNVNCRRSNTAIGSGSAPSGSTYARIRSHALPTSATVAVAAKSANTTSASLTTSTPTCSANLDTTLTCSTDTAPCEAAAANAGNSRNNRPRFTVPVAATGDSRPNAESHARPLRHPSNSDSPRASNTAARTNTAAFS